MVSPPQPGLYAAARRVLLDALEALEDHLDSLVLVGAQAVYLRAGQSTAIADAPYTTDGDLSIDPRSLADQPLLAERLDAAGFHPAREREKSRVGTWEKVVLAASVPDLAEDAVVGVDLLVPEAVSGAGRRGARLGVHGKDVAAKSPGLEAALVDHTLELVTALDGHDPREFQVRVAGPAALLVAKVHKVADRVADAERGRVDRLRGGKDLLDILRLYETQNLDEFAASLRRCLADETAANATGTAIEHLRSFARDDSAAVAYIPEQPTAAATANLRAYFVRYTQALLRAFEADE
jgi:hypothetical protein